MGLGVEDGRRGLCTTSSIVRHLGNNVMFIHIERN